MEKNKMFVLIYLGEAIASVPLVSKCMTCCIRDYNCFNLI